MVGGIRPGGVVAAAVWHHEGEMPGMRMTWERHRS